MLRCIYLIIPVRMSRRLTRLDFLLQKRESNVYGFRLCGLHLRKSKAKATDLRDFFILAPNFTIPDVISAPR